MCLCAAHEQWAKGLTYPVSAPPGFRGRTDKPICVESSQEGLGGSKYSGSCLFVEWH